MGDTLDRPSRGDRRAAVRQVKDAVRAGVIVAADGDLRIQQIQSSGTGADVQAQVRDLVGRTAPAAVAASASSFGPAAPRSEPGVVARVAKAVRKVPRRRFVPALVAVCFGASAVNGLVHGMGHESSSHSSGSVPQTTTVDMFTARAWGDLVDDVRTTTGATLVTRAVMYPSYAAVSVRSGDDETLYSWRGSLDRLTSSPGTTDATVDLAGYRPDVVFGLVDRATKLISAPTLSYVVIQPATLGDGATIYAYASDASGAGAYISAEQDGTIVRTQKY